MPRPKKYTLELTEAELDMLDTLVRNGWADGDYAMGRFKASRYVVAYRLLGKINDAMREAHSE